MTAKRYNLREIFANVNGSSFIGLDTETKVGLKGGKSNEHQGRVKKRTIGSQVMVFTNKEQNGYENMVQRRLIEEGKDPTSFSVGPRPWGTRVDGLPIVEHTDKSGNKKEYLEVIFLKKGKTTYYLDDKPVDRSEIIGLEEKLEDDEKHASDQAGLDNKVIIRTFDSESLLKIRIDSNEYIFRE